MANLKVSYRDVQTEAETSAQGQVDAAKKVRSETQDLLKWVQNELTKLATGWGNATSQIMSWVGLLGTFFATYKFGDWLTKGKLGEFKDEFLKKLGLDSVRRYAPEVLTRT